MLIWLVILIFWQWLTYSGYHFCYSFYGYLLAQNSAESLQRWLEVNDAMNSKVPLCQEVITKIKFDAIVNAANDTSLDGEGIDRAIHEAAWPRLLDECQKVNGCEIGECKVT